MSEAKKMTVLIVDDEPILRENVSLTFKRKGYRVITADNGKAAFELVKSENVDLVISDIRMPGGDGVDLLKQIKDANLENPALIFMTGYSDLSLENAYDMGADAVFGKPFSLKAMVAAAEKALVPRDDRWEPKRDVALENIDIKIEVKFPEVATAIQTKVLNLGRGGMFVALTDRFPKVGSPAIFKIEFSRDSVLSSIEGDGIVRWFRSKATSPELHVGCGIEFNHLNEDCRKQIIDLIKVSKIRAYIPAK